MDGRTLLIAVLALALFGGCDVFVPPAQPGGATYTATVVEQLDSRTLRIDLGPPKPPKPLGVVVVRAIPATRFHLTGGRMLTTYVGSLERGLGIGGSVTVRIETTPRPDGSFTLLELTTNTR